MSSAQFVITHFYRRSPDPGGWIQTIFLTRVVGDRSNAVYLGIPKIDLTSPDKHIISTAISEEKILADVENGSLLELPTGYEIYPGENIWIAADQTVYIANSYDPSRGRQLLVYEDNVSNTYDVINYIVGGLINNKTAKKVIEVLEPFLSKEYWNILTAIIVKYLKAGKISEDDFLRFGFLFRVLNTRYGVQFTQLLNEHDIAYSDDGLLHFHLKLISVKWPVTKSSSEEQADIFIDLASSYIFKTEHVRIEYQESAFI
jgi:hypothetical protein